jgi:hypothetical protein
MQFSHLVEINDPLNPLIDTLTREQLWRGLVLRVEMPKRFVPWLDACQVNRREDQTLERALHYGDTVIRDEVSFRKLQSVHVHVPRQGDIPVADLVMSIEEPGPGRLFVRFEYDDHSGESSGESEEMVNDFRRSAYKESDIDTIRTIREMAADGLLDAPMM